MKPTHSASGRLLERTAADEAERHAQDLLREARRPFPETVRDRAWFGFVRRTEAQPRSSWGMRLGWALAAASLAAAAFFALRSPSPASEHVRVAAGASHVMAVPGRGTIEIEGPAELRIEADGVVIERGSGLHHVRPGHGRFVVTLGRWSVVVRGTTFWTGRAGDDVSVCLVSGHVDVHGPGGRIASLRPGQAWRTSPVAPAFPEALACRLEGSPVAVASSAAPPSRVEAPLEPSQPSAEPPVERRPIGSSRPAVEIAPARTAETCRTAPDAERCYRDAANGSGLSAENGLYALGELLLARGDATGAIQVWQEHRARFPSGALAQETDLRILETRLRLRSPLALEAADRFLASHRGSEHTADVLAIRGTLRQARRNATGALADFEAALGGSISGHRRDDALFGRAAALEALGRSAPALEAYDAYLRERPNGRFAADSRRAIERLMQHAPRGQQGM